MASRPPVGGTRTRPRPQPKPDPYAHERSQPAVPHCGPSSLSIVFDGAMLYLRDGRFQYSWAAVSGKPDERGRFNYSAERQHARSTGPIPEGEYWINPSETWERWFFQTGAEAGWGDYRITLHVMPRTLTHDRGGFFIHGGSRPGSAGCIDLTVGMNRFVARLRTLLQTNPNCFVPVRVQYQRSLR